MRCCLATQCEMPALLNRHIRVLLWLYESGYIDWLRGAGDIAATQGDLEMVQWLHEHEIDGAFTAAAIDAAATHGRTEVLQYLHEHGHKGDSPEGFMQAIARGHTDVVQYLHLQGICKDVCLEQLFALAAEHGRVDELERFKSSVGDERTREKLMNVVVAHGQLEVEQWLGKCHVDATAVHFAARRGHLQMLQWLHDRDCGQWDAWAVGSAATGGHLSVLQWLYQHRRSLFADSGALRAAVDSHALSVAQWLHAHGHDQCSRYVHIAVANGDLPLAKWLHDHREQGSYEFIRNEAQSLATVAQCGHLEMLSRLHENGCEGLTRETTIETPPNVQMWLHHVLGFPITEHVVARAASRGELVFLQWLYEQSDLRAASSSHYHLDQWIRSSNRVRDP